MNSKPNQAYDMQYIHHSHLCPIGKSRKNPHKISASFCEDVEMDPRPHVKMVIGRSNFWGLIDTGASISLCTKKAITQLSKYLKLPFQNHKIAVQDCHSNVKETAGAVTLIFDIINPNSDVIEVKQVKAVFHVVETLSSDVLLGIDILRMIGCNIDMSSEVPEVSFKYKEANAFINSKHPLFVAASAASTCINPELQEYVSRYSFAASPLNDIVINPGDQKTFRVEINTDMHLQLQPGAMVIVQADGLSTKEPSAVMETTFVNVENENKIQVTLANKSTKVTDLPKDQPIPGLLIQSMVAYHTPVEIQKDDIQIMANASRVVKEAEDSVPGFKQHVANIATARQIIPDKTTEEQFVNDEILFANMRESYHEACNALRKTGKPYPGKTQKPEQPCSPEVKAKLLEQLDLSGCDPAHKEDYKNLVLDNWDVFSTDRYDLGHADHWEHIIEPVEEGMNPPFQKQFPIPVNDEDLLRDFATNLTQRKVLLPQYSPGNSPIFIVRKAGTSSPRFVQDLRLTNANSKPDRYQISDIKESLNLAARRKPKIMSSLDLSGSFWQLSLAKESRPWSAFTLPFMATQYIWTRTPMGARGSTASFAKFLHIVFRDCPEVITYVDDLITMAQSHEEMITNLQKIFDILRLNNLKLNLKKCRFGQAELDWLGFTINQDGIKPEMSKVQKCRELQPPTSAKDIEKLLPFMAFNSQCLEKFQMVAGPLTDLTKKDSKWKSIKRHGPLPKEALNAFYALKNMLLERPLIYWPNTSLPFQMFTDASVGTEEKQGAISAVLTQVQNGITRPIGYYSRRMRSSENKYNSFNSELLAIEQGLQHWRQILVGSQLTVFTDHRPAVDHITKRQQKTMSALCYKISAFDCDIQHIMGKDNLIADYLSRNVNDDTSVDNDDKATAKNEMPKTVTDDKFNTGLDSLSLNVRKSKQTIQAGTSKQPEQTEASADNHSTTSSNNNNNKKVRFIGSSQKLSNSVQSGELPLDSRSRQALLAKEHRQLGFVGSNRRHTAAGIAAAGVIDKSSKQFWLQSQMEDPITSALIKYVTTGQRPIIDDNNDDNRNEWLNLTITQLGHKLTVEDGLLYYYGTYRKSPLSKKLYVPESLVTPIIADAHDAATGGHWGTEATVATLMEQYFWLSMAADVREFINKCQICYILDDPNARKTRSEIHARKVPPRQGYRVHADLVGPLHSITDDNYCLTLVDGLTKWTVLVPIKNKEPDTVAKAIVDHWLLNVSQIETLVSDQGAEFTAKTVQAMADYMHIKLHTTGAYSPRSNGAAERVHRSLGKFLTIYTNEIGTDWTDFVKPLQYSLNTKCHSSTGVSPWYLTYGRYPCHPWRNEYYQRKLYGEDEATRRHQLIQYALEMVKKNDQESKTAYTKAYNKRCRNRAFQLGDAVLVHFPKSAIRGKVNRKFMRDWHGIYFVKQVLGPNVYMVSKPGCRKTKVPSDRLKIFNEFLHADDPTVNIAPEDEEEEEIPKEEEEEKE